MMKAAIIFTLLLTTVLCRPARKPVNSSESSEEQVKPVKGNAALALPQETAAVQKVLVSEDSSVTSEEAVVDMVSAVKSAITDILSESASLPDPSATPDTASDQSQDDDDADDDDNSQDTDEDESDESSESTLSPVTVTTAMVVETAQPTADGTPGPNTPEPITPTVVIDQGRGDSLGRYPSDYKSILYVEDKSYQKVPSPYKSYEILDGGKKMAYDLTDANDVQKGLKVYKALQVHNDLLEEDTSTPEVESQGLDTSSPDQEASPKQALLPAVQEQEASFSPSDATPTESSSATEEEEEELEEEESTASPSDSASASQDSDDSEDATATPGAADSQSDESDSAESDSDEEGAAAPDAATATPELVSAK